jgi:uncharacterized membrane protein YbaN (DUF454 family)
MTRREAQEILLSCRPGREPADDPQVAAALELARTDPELHAWYEQHRAWDAAVRQQLGSIPVPPDLRWEILSGRKIVTGPAHWWNRPAALSAAAALIAALVVLSVVFLKRPSSSPDTFAEFRTNVIATALREYKMDLQTNDMRQIRGFLATRGAPSDYVAPAGLDKLKLVGCGVLNWKRKPVSMICFEDQRERGIWLFAIKATHWKDRPGDQPAFHKVFSCPAASWSEGETVYVLAGDTKEPELRKLL